MGIGEGAEKRRAKASPPDSWLEIEDKTITLNVAATAKLAAELPKISVVADEESAGDYAVIMMRDDVANEERLFAVTKHFLAHEMERGRKASAVKRNRIHDIRHSHVSLLNEMGFSALAIAERMGHEAVDITYRYAHLFPTKQDEMAAALDGVGDKQDPRENSVRKRSKTMAIRCTSEEHKLICEMAAWSGMSRQDYSSSSSPIPRSR